MGHEARPVGSAGAHLVSTLVLCPSRGRPEHAAATLASFLETRRDPDSRLVFIVDEDDPTGAAYPCASVRLVPPTGSMGGAIRAAVADGQLLGAATSVGMIGDDCRFVTPGWDVILDGWLTANVGVAWPEDGWDHPWASESKAAHWWLSRTVMDAFGIAPPTEHLFMDDYWAALGNAAGCSRYFPDVLVEHLHPLAGKGSPDATYDRSRQWIRHDKAWWETWKRTKLAHDAARLRALAGKPAPVRVFADWHHPALWEALSIVFEDRFGWELYSPLGMRWIRHGWQLQGGTPGWNARLYLEHPAVLVGDYHELVEPEYPGRPRKLVTWEQFESQPWDIVIASVGQHQRTFADLARRKGALYVHHIGDAKRRQDPRAKGVTMASAVMPGVDVTHHQEFDTRLFSYTPPTDPHAVSSLMLRLATTSCPHEWLSQAPGIHWSAVECVGMRDPGYLAPMSVVADRIRSSGWVWHDKRIGDGYGHVLFTAAAMGRPVIGHASHYHGLLGEPLWEDLRTCIDLDRHDADEALGLWRAISDDPDRHGEMCSAIRARFDELVDWDAEAESIRAALA